MREPFDKSRMEAQGPIDVSGIALCLFSGLALNAVNSVLESGEPIEWEQKEGRVSTDLRVFVHIGPYGLQKVGHICFAYRGIVYSYGNYDQASFRFNRR